MTFLMISLKQIFKLTPNRLLFVFLQIKKYRITRENPIIINLRQMKKFVPKRFLKKHVNKKILIKKAIEFKSLF